MLKVTKFHTKKPKILLSTMLNLTTFFNEKSKTLTTTMLNLTKFHSKKSEDFRKNNVESEKKSCSKKHKI